MYRAHVPCVVYVIVFMVVRIKILKVSKVPKDLKDSKDFMDLYLLDEYLLAVDNVDTLAWVLYLAALKVIDTFHL